MPDCAQLLIDPLEDPEDELRRFQGYYDEVVAALADQRGHLVAARDIPEPADVVGRLNRDYSLRLLETRIRHLEEDLDLRTEHLAEVRTWMGRERR